MRYTGKTMQIKGDGMFDSNYLSRYFRKAPNLPHKLVRLYEKFSLTNIIEGLGYVKGVAGKSKNGTDINGCYYEWELQGEENQTSIFASGSTSGSNIGLNQNSFTICLEDNYFNINDIAKLENEQLIFFLSNGVKNTSGKYVYTAKVHGGSMSETIPQEYLQQGRRLSYRYNAVGDASDKGYIKSRKGSELHREYATLFRHDYQVSGLANSTLWEIEYYGSDKSKGTMWVTEAEKIAMENFFRTKEQILLDGKSNVDLLNGENFLGQDPTSKQRIITGNGLENQLHSSCKQTYSRLTKTMLQDVIQEVKYRSGKTQGVDILLVTGSQGSRQFMDLMEDSLKQGDNVYATRSGNNITMGGNFNKYIYNGCSITVTENYVLDYRDEADELDESGMPLRSSKMYFIDRSTYDGEPNLEIFHQNGIKMIVNDIPGVGGKDGKSSGTVSSPVHAYTKVFMGSVGLKVTNPFSSMILQKAII